MKDKSKSLGALVVLLGMALSKYMGNKYGINGRLSVGICGLVMGLIAVIVLIFRKNYLGALVVCFIFLPVTLGLIGVYLNNVYMAIAGVVLLVVFLKIIIKVLPKFNKNKK